MFSDINQDYNDRFAFIKLFYYIKNVITNWIRPMTNEITPEGIELIKSFEGFRSKAYRDAGGKWTIGYGHTKNVHAGDIVTKERALELFKTEVADYGHRIRPLIKVPVNNNQFSALVSFVYNLGVGALKRSTLLKRLNGGDYKLKYDGIIIIERQGEYQIHSVLSEFERWCRIGDEPYYGLLRRRKAEYKLFMTNGRNIT